MMSILIDRVGQNYGRLTVERRTLPDDRGRARWVCRCDCGARLVVRGDSLINGNTESCGCLQLQQQIAANLFHGMRHTQEYTAWDNAKARCHNPLNPSFDRYGGRGIAMCAEWRANFAAFLSHIGPKPDPSLTLDRINNDLGYEPGNVRWTTSLVQVHNRRPRRKRS